MLSYFLLILFPIFFGVYCNFKVILTYQKWSYICSRRKITGYEVSKKILETFKIYDVDIIQSDESYLNDYYDPINKKIALGKKNYLGTSLSSIGVAAHEASHAIQHNQSEFLFRLRLILYPSINFISKILPIIIFGGLFLGILGFIKIGIILYFFLFLFQGITLPIEMDASKKALKVLLKLNIINQKKEIYGIKKVLNAAILTYLSSYLSSICNFIYFFIILRKNNY
jgi:Zn-dependent membrane protease YugP